MVETLRIELESRMDSLMYKIQKNSSFTLLGTQKTRLFQWYWTVITYNDKTFRQLVD